MFIHLTPLYETTDDGKKDNVTYSLILTIKYIVVCDKGL
jgi:hypothetical protein